MADLSKELPLESLSDESWFADKNARKAKVVSRAPSNNAEKSLYRQMAWVNNNTDHLGDILRFLNKFEVVATPDTAEKQHFNAGNKTNLMQKLRAVSVSNNNNAAYLRLAKDFGYEAADEFENGVSEDMSMDESTANKMDKIAKKHAAKAEKFRQAPYQKRTVAPQSHQYPQQTAQQYPQMFPQTSQYGHPMFTPQQYPQAPQQYPQAPLQYPQAPQQYPQAQFSRFPPFGVPGAPGRGRGHGGGINKTNSICKDCKGIGHWGGDAECPWTAPNQLALTQPKPPGTN